MMEPMNDEDDDIFLVNNMIYDVMPNGDSSDQVWNSCCTQQKQGSSDSDNNNNNGGDTLDIIIHVASRLEKLFRCGTCDAYVRKQVEFERTSPDGVLPVEMQMYQTFLWED